MEVTLVYSKDTKKFKVYQVETGSEIVGSLYFPKSWKLPESVKINIDNVQPSQES